MNAALGGLTGLLEGQNRDIVQSKERISLIIEKLNDAERVMGRIMKSNKVKSIINTIMTEETIRDSHEGSPSDYTVGTSPASSDTSSKIADVSMSKSPPVLGTSVAVTPAHASPSPLAVQIVSPSTSQAISPVVSPSHSSKVFCRSSLSQRSQHHGVEESSKSNQKLSVSISSVVSDVNVKTVPSSALSPLESSMRNPPTSTPGYLATTSPQSPEIFDLSVTYATQPSPLMLSKKISRGGNRTVNSSVGSQRYPTRTTSYRSSLYQHTKEIERITKRQLEDQILTVPQEFTPSDDGVSETAEEWVDDTFDSSSSLISSPGKGDRCDASTNTVVAELNTNLQSPTRTASISHMSKQRLRQRSLSPQLSKTSNFSGDNDSSQLLIPPLQLRDRAYTAKPTLAPTVVSMDLSPRDTPENTSFTSYSRQLLDTTGSPVASTGSKSPREVRTSLRNRFGSPNSQRQPSDYNRNRRVSRTFSEEDKQKLLDRRESGERTTISDLQQEDSELLMRVHQLGLLNCSESGARHLVIKTMRRAGRDIKNLYDKQTANLELSHKEETDRLALTRDETTEWKRLLNNESQLIAWQKQHQKYVIGGNSSQTPPEQSLVTCQSKEGANLICKPPVALSGVPTIPSFSPPIDMKLLLHKALTRHWRKKTDNRKNPPRSYYINVKSKESVWDLEERLAKDKQNKYRKKVLGPDWEDRLYPASCQKCKLWWKGVPHRWRCTSCGTDVWQPSSRELVVSRYCFACKIDISKVPPFKTPNCRACGRVCCSDCCSEQMPLPQIGFSGQTLLPVCKLCVSGSQSQVV